MTQGSPVHPQVEERIRKLPDHPGIYIYRDEKGKQALGARHWVPGTLRSSARSFG